MPKLYGRSTLRFKEKDGIPGTDSQTGIVREQMAGQFLLIVGSATTRYEPTSCRIVLWYQYWYIRSMSANRKITLELPEDLLRKAQECTGEGVTATIRRGLELLATSTAYDELQKLRGKVKFSVKLKDLRNDQ